MEKIFYLDPKIVDIADQVEKELVEERKALFEKYRAILTEKVAKHLPEGYTIGSVNAGCWVIKDGNFIASDCPPRLDEETSENSHNAEILNRLSKFQFSIGCDEPLIEKEIDGTKK